MNKILYWIANLFYWLLNGHTLATRAEVKRVDEAIEKVESKFNSISYPIDGSLNTLNSINKKRELLVLQKQLISYKSKLWKIENSKRIRKFIGPEGFATSEMVDEILDPNWEASSEMLKSD